MENNCQERGETILRTVPDMIYVLDGDFRFTFVNEAMVSVTGYDREELLGTHASILFDEGTLDEARWTRDRLDAGELRFGRLETELETADGDRIPCEIRGRFLPGDGCETGGGTAGVIRNITERRRRERELQRKNERLEEFASVVSHDLRNPLNVTEGRLELAREDCDSKHLDAALEAVDRMETLIDDLLTLAQEGEQRNDLVPVELETTARSCWRTVETGDATLVTDTDQTIHADPSRVKQLLANLMRNAVEHGGEDVTITIGDLSEKNGFYIADDGPGIPADQRDEVFNVGYSTTRDDTGFGLEIVRTIVEAHSWTVNVTESGSGGARFEITDIRTGTDSA